MISQQEILQIAAQAVKMYSESHPRPPHITQVQAAEILGLTPHTVGRMVKRGVFRLNRVGMIPISQIDEAIAANKSAR